MSQLNTIEVKGDRAYISSSINKDAFSLLNSGVMPLEIIQNDNYEFTTADLKVLNCFLKIIRKYI